MEHWLEWKTAQWVCHEGSIRRPIAPCANALTTELRLAPKWREINTVFLGTVNSIADVFKENSSHMKVHVWSLVFLCSVSDSLVKFNYTACRRTANLPGLTWQNEACSNHLRVQEFYTQDINNNFNKSLTCLDLSGSWRPWRARRPRWRSRRGRRTTPWRWSGRWCCGPPAWRAGADTPLVAGPTRHASPPARLSVRNVYLTTHSTHFIYSYMGAN